MDEYRQASKHNKEVFKGAKYLLLKNTPHLQADEKSHLTQLLSLNHNLLILVILKDMLKDIWRYRRRGWALKALAVWSAIARRVGHPAVDRFARRLERYSYGILNHCDYPIHTCRLEGVNNKIKVIKRKA